MNIVSMPGFFAERALYKTNGRYRLSAVLAADIGGRALPAVSKGTTCSVADPECASGFSKLFCPSFDADDCVETGQCCTKPPGGGGGGNPNCLIHNCAPGHACCRNGCCPQGAHCCSDGHGCCPNGRTCRSFLGQHFCSPI
jgi:hypothetical protein